jgi:hypothetical protein
LIITSTYWTKEKTIGISDYYCYRISTVGLAILVFQYPIAQFLVFSQISTIVMIFHEYLRKISKCSGAQAVSGVLAVVGLVLLMASLILQSSCSCWYILVLLILSSLLLIPVLTRLIVLGIPSVAYPVAGVPSIAGISVVADVSATIYVLLSLLLQPNPPVADVLVELAPRFDSTAISDVAACVCLWCPICYWLLVTGY